MKKKIIDSKTKSKSKSLRPVASELIKELSFCVFDLETTGGNHHFDKIIEIGMVKISKLKIVEKKEFLINPEIKIPDFIQKLTSISPKDTKNSPTIPEVIDEITDFLGDSVLVAHNTSFDVPFLNSVLKRLGRPELSNKSICTNLMTKYLIPNLLNSNLNYMSKIFHIRHRKAHRALDDAEAAAKLLIKYLHIFIEKGIQKINHLYYPRNRYELDRINFKKKTPNARIIKSLKKIKSSYLFTIKGKNGIIHFSYPSLGATNAINFLQKQLDHYDWELCTVLLFGPYLEALIAFNNFFPKIQTPIKTDIVNSLWSEHFPRSKKIQMPGSKLNDKNSPLNQQKTFDEELGDYIIMNHLVPEQYIIYPIASMHSKSELIFRYPGHKKKLIQYINSKTSRIRSKKLKKVYFHPLLKDFIEAYIKEKAQNQSDMLVINREFPEKKPEDFLKTLEDFLVQNPNTNNYPKEYI